MSLTGDGGWRRQGGRGAAMIASHQGRFSTLHPRLPHTQPHPASPHWGGRVSSQPAIIVRQGGREGRGGNQGEARRDGIIDPAEPATSRT